MLISRRETHNHAQVKKNVFSQDLITISLLGGMEEVGVSPVRNVLGLSMARWEHAELSQSILLLIFQSLTSSPLPLSSTYTKP